MVQLRVLVTFINHLAKIDCWPGVLYDFFKMMHLKVEKMDAKARLSGFVGDDMSISPKQDYDSATQSMYGYQLFQHQSVLLKKGR